MARKAAIRAVRSSTADYIIDMGPEGGDGGGTVIAQGTPEEICEVKQSYTGRFLKQYLEKDKDKL